MDNGWQVTMHSSLPDAKGWRAGEPARPPIYSIAEPKGARATYIGFVSSLFGLLSAEKFTRISDAAT